MQWVVKRDASIPLHKSGIHNSRLKPQEIMCQAKGDNDMAAKKTYDTEYKVQAVKLGREIGFSKAARELKVNPDTLYGWNRAVKDAKLDLGPGSQTPESAASLVEEVQMLRKQTRDMAKEINRLKEENEFLAEASAFFAASRRKSTKS